MINYLLSKDEWNRYSEFVQSLILEYGSHKICDIGGGANPVLPLHFIVKYQLDCTVLDISSEELQKAPSEYKKIKVDIEATEIGYIDRFDFAVTKMLAEHIKNGVLFHKNIYKLLVPGGIAVHYFPTLYAMPFLINKLVPSWFSSFLLNVILPRNRFQFGKFRAYYNWCYGPSPKMLNLFAEIGYEIIEFRGFFGNAYYSRIPVIKTFHAAYSRYLSKHPNPFLTSYAQIILRKPVNATVI